MPTTENVIAVVEPYLIRIRDLGRKTLVEATPDGAGRHVKAFRALSERTGLNIITNCGMWVEIDAISGSRDLPAVQLDLLQRLLADGLEDQVLLSQDAGGYGEKTFRPYDRIFTEFLPLCRHAGISQATTEKILIHNPSRVLDIAWRTASHPLRFEAVAAVARRWGRSKTGRVSEEVVMF